MAIGGNGVPSPHARKPAVKENSRGIAYATIPSLLTADFSVCCRGATIELRGKTKSVTVILNVAPRLSTVIGAGGQISRLVAKHAVVDFERGTGCATTLLQQVEGSNVCYHMGTSGVRKKLRHDNANGGNVTAVCHPCTGTGGVG